MDDGMSRTTHRLAVLQKHLHINKRKCLDSVSINTSSSCPTITVSPRRGMVDEPVTIQLTGFRRRENVTLVASMVENKVEFTSRCVYQTDDDGCADNGFTASTGGSFLGIEPMGLFWSLASDPPTRLVKKDVTSPMLVNVQVFEGSVNDTNCSRTPVAQEQVERLFLRPGVKRVELTGKVQGTLFIPEGNGPFPALIDLYGSLVSLIETRAALLASHGYVTMALCYLYKQGLAQDVKYTDINYITGACQWLTEQDYVDKQRFGAIGLCFGGCLCLKLTSVLPQIRAVVNVNGIPFSPTSIFPGTTTDSGAEWPDKSKIILTEEGIDVTEIYECENPRYFPAWQHGAKVLVIVGEDDKQVTPKWHSCFYDNCPDKYKPNLQIYRYHGAGHMIEPPFTPHIRAIVPGKKRLQSVYFLPEKYHDCAMMAGGWTASHAQAQEDSWKKILNFLEINVKNV